MRCNVFIQNIRRYDYNDCRLEMESAIDKPLYILCTKLYSYFGII